MAIESMAVQGVVKEDTVEAFWVVKDEDDDRGGVYPTALGFFVPSFGNLFFTPDYGAVIRGYKEHEKGHDIRLDKKVRIPVDVVLKVVNIKKFQARLAEWASKLSY